MAGLVVVTLFLAPSFRAQHRRPVTPTSKVPAAQSAVKREPTPTFDTLLAADSYKIYGEIRSIGQLIRSNGVNDLLDPIVKLAGPPKELRTIVKWLNAHADEVMTSRVMIASWPVRSNLPQALVAIEFTSPEEAQKFEPQLKRFLGQVIPNRTPTLSPSPASTPAAGKNENPATATKTEMAPRYLIKQTGSLITISDSPFSFRNLRPRESNLLNEEQNFRLVHDRFAGEQIFLYFNVALADKETQEREKQQEEQNLQLTNEVPPPVPEQQTVTAEVSESAVTSQTQAGPPVQAVPNSAESTASETVVQASPEPITITDGPPSTERTSSGTLGSSESQPANMMLFLLGSGFFGGSPKWPEAIGAAIAFDSDAYVLRTLLINGRDSTPSAIPFFPRFVSGPALTAEAASILPSDTELFVAASVDYVQIYDGMIKSIANENEEMRRRTHQPAKGNETESPFAFYEKKLGINVKDDLLPLLGNEIAFTLPVKSFGVRAARMPAPQSESELKDEEREPRSWESSSVVAISIRNREAVQKLIPRLIDSFAVKGASLLAHTEKREDTELVSFGDAVSCAFIGNFLVISADVAATRHVIDSYLNHDTLISNSHFRNFTRWQPRQLLGQIYVSPALMESYQAIGGDITSSINEKMRDFITRISPIAEPITYALSNEGMGPFHELHIPRNLLMLMVAGISNGASESPLSTNEAVAKSAVRTVGSAETTYKSTKGNGSFATLEELISEGLVAKDLLQNYGYHIEVTVSNNKFEISAVPAEYGKTGKLSYFLDETSVLRGADHGGGPASVSDQPVQ